MIFDNPSTRIPQKAREQKKRREKREMAGKRGKVEIRRKQRLRELRKMIEVWENLNEDQKRVVGRLLGGWERERGKEMEMAKERDKRELLSSFFQQDENGDSFSYDANELFQEGDGQETFLSKGIESIPQPQLSDQVYLESLSPSISIDSDSTLLDKDIDLDFSKLENWFTILESQTSTPFALAKSLQRLKLDFQKSLSSTSSSTSSSTFSTFNDEETNYHSSHETDDEFVFDPELNSSLLSSTTSETYAQSKLTSLESSIYSSFFSNHSSSPSSHLQALSLQTLTSQNASLLNSYTKSSSPFPSSLYADCATLSSLMGVPVLWTGKGGVSGGKPHEAEALASMLVKNGHADLVGSEDSDVVLYEVPLLRGLIGKSGLEIVDSRRVREELFPVGKIKSQWKDESLYEVASPVLSFKPEDSNFENSDPGSNSKIASTLESGSSNSESTSTNSSEPITQKKSNHQIELEKLENESRRKMMDFALLCGTDFNRTIKGVGSKTALKLIQ